MSSQCPRSSSRDSFTATGSSRFRFSLPDKPGELQKVAGVIAAVNGNVIKLEHNQFVSVNRSAAVELRITLEAFGTEHKQQILTALEKNGYAPRVVQTVI